MEPVFVDPIGEPTTTDPVFGDEMLIGGGVVLADDAALVSDVAVSVPEEVSPPLDAAAFSKLRQPTG